MPRTPKSPQEKKRLSREKDRRNTYGENAKASRKAIPRNKANAHRAVRRIAKSEIARAGHLDEGEAETRISTISKARLQKGRWRKVPDTPLGRVIERKLNRRQEH